MAWKCHDDLTGEVINGEPAVLQVMLDGVGVRTYDVAPCVDHQDTAVTLLDLGRQLVEDAALAELARGGEAPEPQPDPPAPAEDPAPSAPFTTPVNGAALAVAPESSWTTVGHSDGGVDVVRREPQLADDDDGTPRDGDAQLRAEALLLDTDEVWTPKRVSEETGLSLSDARAVLAKVRREARTR